MLINTEKKSQNGQNQLAFHNIRVRFLNISLKKSLQNIEMRIIQTLLTL